MILKRTNMKLKSIIDSVSSMRYCIENLNLGSSYSRTCLLNLEMMDNKDQIIEWQDEVIKYSRLLDYPLELQSIRHLFSEIKDINSTIQALSQGSRILDDIEFFELKSLCMHAISIKSLFQKYEIEIDIPQDISIVLEILDPDKNNIISFYVYDSYSSELAALRLKINSTEDVQKRQDLIILSQELELNIRERLTQQLSPYSEYLKKSLELLATIDIQLAQAELSKLLSLSRPIFSDDGSYQIKQMFNPEVKNILNLNNKNFQAIDIEIGKEPVLIIGANMGGKTLILLTLSLIQHLAQFGFDVPATEATIALKKEIHISVGDAQNELEGLSSFSAEMLKIDKIIASSTPGKDIIAFIDEPARSTNPIEATALVSALLKVLSDKQISLLVTTHYNPDSNHCIRYKIKGLQDSKMNYSLELSGPGDVPHEAINVAQNLGISPLWLDEARKILEK